MRRAGVPLGHRVLVVGGISRLKPELQQVRQFGDTTLGMQLVGFGGYAVDVRRHVVLDVAQDPGKTAHDNRLEERIDPDVLTMSQRGVEDAALALLSAQVQG